jgi:transcriptional regulator with XRE-family HTH domain
MPATPHPAGRQPQPGSRLPSQVVADNVKALREYQKRSQAYLAGLMRDQGVEWSQSTVSQVELGARHVNVDELYALALALELTNPVDLLNPLTAANLGKQPWERPFNPADGQGGGKVDLGVAKPVPGEFIDRWLDNRLAAIRLFVTDGETHLFSAEFSVQGVDGEPLE